MNKEQLQKEIKALESKQTRTDAEDAQLVALKAQLAELDSASGSGSGSGDGSGSGNTKTEITRPKPVAVLAGEIDSIGNTFDQNGKQRRAVVIETGSNDVAASYRSYAGLVQVAGSKVTVFMSAGMLNNVSEGAKINGNITQRIKDVTQYTSNGNIKFHTSDHYGLENVSFTASASDKQTSENLRKLQQYGSDSKNLDYISKLTAAGAQVKLDL